MLRKTIVLVIMWCLASAPFAAGVCAGQAHEALSVWQQDVLQVQEILRELNAVMESDSQGEALTDEDIVSMIVRLQSLESDLTLALDNQQGAATDGLQQADECSFMLAATTLWLLRGVRVTWVFLRSALKTSVQEQLQSEPMTPRQERRRLRKQIRTYLSLARKFMKMVIVGPQAAVNTVLTLVQYSACRRQG